MLPVGPEQLVRQVRRQRVLPDQRVGQQRPHDVVAAARARGLHGQPLVGLGVLDEAEHLGRQRPLRKRVGAAGVDDRRRLDHGVVGQARDGTVVAHVDDLHVPGARVQRRHQANRGQRVVRAAAVRQLLRLRDQRGVPVLLAAAWSPIPPRRRPGSGDPGSTAGPPRHRVGSSSARSTRAAPAADGDTSIGTPLSSSSSGPKRSKRSSRRSSPVITAGPGPT